MLEEAILKKKKEQYHQKQLEIKEVQKLQIEIENEK